MKTNSSMTIYNKYFNPITRADSWQRHVIYEVFWDSTSGITQYKGLIPNDKVTIYIPFNSNYMNFFIDPKTFQINHTGYWTIQNGDIIVKGIINDEITKQSELESEYPNVFNVSSITINNYGSPNMRHIEVIGT